MLKKTMRKALIPSALAAVLLTTGCTSGATTAQTTTSTSPVSSSAAPNVTGTLERVPPKSPAATTTPAKTVTPSAPKAPVAKVPAASGNSSSVVAQAKAAINSIPVKGRAPKTGYDRDKFGPAWADVDRNGCDTRNDILARDLTGETFKDGTKQCVVATGVLKDPYTGKTINFVRGAKTSSAVQVDHMIPLSLAWQQGAQQWTAEKRKQFANDPINLRAADGPTNGSKSDSGPGSWLPPNSSFRCQYIAEFVIVADKYDLSMNPGDHNASKRILDGC